MCKKPMQIKALRRWHGLARPVLKKTCAAQSGAHVFFLFHRESIMKTLLSILALGAALSTFGSAAAAAAPAAGGRDPFLSSDAVSAATGPAVIQLARQGRGRGGDSGGSGRGRGGDSGSSNSGGSSSGDAGRGRGADDGPGDDRGGRGTDDPVGDDRGRGRGTDDGAGHQHRGRGQDDGPNHT